MNREYEVTNPSVVGAEPCPYVNCGKPAVLFRMRFGSEKWQDNCVGCVECRTMASSLSGWNDLVHRIHVISMHYSVPVDKWYYSFSQIFAREELPGIVSTIRMNEVEPETGIYACVSPVTGNLFYNWDECFAL